jgi:Transposase DDE domain/Domain of unknown function (DUF4372)
VDGRHKATAVRLILVYKRHGIDSTQFGSFPDESDMNRTNAVPHQNTVFRQLLQRLPQATLQRLVGEYHADKGVRTLTTAQLLSVMLFAHLSGAKGLRDIPAILESQDARRYHSGLPQAKRSTVADALAVRPYEVFAGVLAALIPKVTGQLARGIGECVRLIDSTTVRLNRLSQTWSRFSADLCGAKAHVIYDPDANCPLYLSITPARTNDITAAQAMPIEPGCTYVFDLGYYDFAWWAKLDDAGCRIVTRLKANTPLRVIETRAVPAEAETVHADRIGFLPARSAKTRTPPMDHAVREIEVETKPGTVLRVLTNDLDAPAAEIAALYQRRWMIELFFRWVKQTLKLRHFFGTSDNAVRIQIAVAMIAFVLIRLAHTAQTAVTGLTEFARLVAANVLHRRPLASFKRNPGSMEPGIRQNRAQGVLL